MVTTPSTTARPGETSHRAAILSTLRLLEPACVPGMAKCRVGAPADGGYVMLDDLEGISVCYSLGIGQDVSWDLAMARRGALIRQYDHTVSSPPVAHPLFRHRRTGISHDDARRPHMRRLDSLMRENGDAERRDMILKVDIEGHEWGALGVLGLNDLACFRQIIVEFHGLGLMALPSFRQRAHDVFARLCASHAVVHVHGNNFAGMQDAAGIKLPDCIEVTFANRGRYRFAPATDTFPGPLDAANDKSLPDLCLGSFKAADLKVGSAPDTASSIFEIVAERATGSSHEVLALPAYVLAAVREELSALARLHRPERPPHDTYRLGPALLDEATAVCARHGIRLDDPVADGLGQAIRDLRKCLGDLSWSCHADTEGARAVACLIGFLQFHASWRHHPLFPGMLANLAAQGFSLQGLSTFAAAYCLALHGAHVNFPIDAGTPAPLDRFSLADGPAEAVVVQVCNLGVAEFGTASGFARLYRAVEAYVATGFSSADVTRRGVLVLFGGVEVDGLQSALVESVKRALQAHGWANANLLAVAPLLFNIRVHRDPCEVSLGYHFTPVANGSSGRIGSPASRRNTGPPGYAEGHVEQAYRAKAGRTLPWRGDRQPDL